MRTRTYILLTQSAFLALLLIVGALVYLGIQRNASATARADHTQQTLTQIETVLRSVVEQETGLRGFLLNDDRKFLEPYQAAATRLPAEIAQLRQLETNLPDDDTQEHLATIATVERLLREWESDFAQPAQALQQEGLEPLIAFTRRGTGKRIVDEIRSEFAAYQADELAEITTQRAVAARSLRRVQGLTIIGITIAVLAAVLAALSVSSRLSSVFGNLTRTTRRLADGDLQERVPPQLLREANELGENFNRMAEQLAEKVQELTRTNEEMKILGELTDHLQTCTTLDEGYELLGKLLPVALHGTSGSIAIMKASKTTMDVMVTWGSASDAEFERSFNPESCLAIRRGRPYDPEGQHLHLPCLHTAGIGQHLCLPLNAQGEVLGLLRLNLSDDASSATREFVARVAAQVALALGNLRLRDHLNNLSIRDPLTGLFNRRYLEETVEREVHRMWRHKHPVSVLMFDIDHFKRFNDLHGHAAGDAVLKELSELIRAFFRKEDVPCRHGGEEFVVLLAHATLDQARERAEGLRQRVERLHVQHQGRELGQVTISVGVAAFEVHGHEASHVFEAADAALYRAKHAGRNQVMVAEVLSKPL